LRLSHPIRLVSAIALAIGLVWLAVAAGATAALALEPVSIAGEDTAVDLTSAVEFHSQQSASLKVSTAPDRDRIVRRIEVRARNAADLSHWAVFALANNTNEQIDRLIVAPRYRLVGSGVFWPDLDSARIAAITPSEGFSLEPLEDREADAFLITLDPGAVVTLIAELRTPKLPKLYLWAPEAYKDTINSYTLYRGIVLGISGLLAVFLTILFVVRGTAMFPAAAALAWSVLAYVCVDFGFLDRILSVGASGQPVWRAAAEVAIATSLIIFFYAYLNLNRWHRYFSIVAIAWLLSLALLIGVAIVLPDVAAGIARLSIGASCLAAALLIVWMTAKGYDRAVMLIPTWTLALAWLYGAGMTVTGALSNDVVQAALAGGLVLIVMLLGFTVMQYAFAGGALAQGLVSNVERQAMALTGSGYIVWDWDAARDFIHVGEEAAHALGLPDRALNGPVKTWIALLHPNDRDRFRSALDAMSDHKRGRLSLTLRLRGDNGQYHWFNLKARPLLGIDGEVIRCVGTVADVTDSKTAEERLLRDSVHDNLTGLANRQLFVTRLEAVMAIARRNAAARPSVFHVNIDNFRDINARHGFGVGDTILLTVARRLTRLLRDGDSLARLGADQFAILLISETAADKIAAFGESIRRMIKAPVQFAGEEIELSSSIGISTWTADHTEADAPMRDAELAMLHAKRFGGNRIEPFRPAFRAAKDERTILSEDLSQAVARRQLTVAYQPIFRLAGRTIAGFEALVRWQHPRLGLVLPVDFIPLAERSGAINEIGAHVLETAAQDFKRILQRTGEAGLFVAVNISSRELLRHDLVNDVDAAVKKAGIPPQMLRMEITESLAMENPENSSDVLSRIRALGVGLSLDDFGTGYSSLAYLMRFPVDTLKIDKSFVQARDRKERLVVLRAIVAMAQGLGQKVVAEGIEYESDVTELMQMGCQFGQGFLFGDALPIDKVEAMLTREFKMAGQ
jgi:diguanylate cyclase (GGDEF)-like protein/PAS domain S-box-containing protein